MTKKNLDVSMLENCQFSRFEPKTPINEGNDE